ncbi:major capsid protein [Pseudomonas sediminis]|uniref:major capsid protein n=1 Tax=Pseudomonas sediminis TaxID=1691904 RepID=UPI00244C1918|nr:major capsid protein [Pseudomonas sediminis]MDG9760969.1 major capsid protein [Pseudomonas sediminis]
MKLRNTLRHYGRQIGAVSVISAFGIGQAYASAADVVTKMEGGEGDISIIGYAGLGLLVAAALFKYMRRAV